MRNRKQPIYTDHARDQMKDRVISEEEVEFVLNQPEVIRPGDGDCSVLTAHPSGRFIKIVVSTKRSRVIITAAD